MNPRTTGILFLVAAAIFAWVYFYEIRGEEGRKEAEAATQQLFPDVEADDVEWIELVTTDDSAARLERRPEGWVLTQPLEFPGDAFAADGIASALAQLNSEQVIESPQPLAVYGLDDARELRFASAGAEHRLKTGDKTPLGSNSYATTGASESIYTVPSFRVNALQKSLFDLREKRLLRFDTMAITGIEASWPGGKVVLERGDDGWRLVQPSAGPADAGVVEKLLADLSFLRAVGFQDESLPDEAIGLSTPDFAVELTVASQAAPPDEAGAEDESAGGEARVLHLAIGASLDGEYRLARAVEPSLYRIQATRLSELPRTLSAYRFKQLSDFDPDAAKRVEISLRSPAGESLAITATRGESGWTAEPEDFQAGKLSQLVDALSQLAAADILADAMGQAELAALQLAPANATLRVFGAEPEGGGEAPLLAELRLGVLRDGGGIAAQAGGNDMVFELDHAVAERVPMSLAAFRNRFAAGAPEAPGAEGGEDAAPADPEIDFPFSGEESP